MQIEVVLTADEIRQEQIMNHTVIILDILRASSTIVTALHSGFQTVFPVETIGQALSLNRPDAILAGERHCKNIHDFDFNNSPTELLKSGLKGKNLILTTTNGTRAIQKAARAEALFIGCFLNATPCICEALSRNLDITLYCAGSRQKYALEDGLGAGLFIHTAKKINPNIRVCDMGKTLESSYQFCSSTLSQQLRNSTTGKRLLALHYEEDIDYCSQVDVTDLVPIVKDKRILSLFPS